MRYATAYDIGDRKRDSGGINEDSIEIAVFEDGHREGYRPQHLEDTEAGGETPEESDPDSRGAVTIHGSGDEPVQAAETTAETGVATPDAEPDGWQNRTAGVFVLADGAGGEESGDIASYIATLKLTQELSETLHGVLLGRTGEFDIDLDETTLPSSVAEQDDETLERAIEEAIASANRGIVEHANAADIDGLYTTVVAGVYVGNQFHYGWVGDSRIYVINQSHEQIARLTEDHAKIARLESQGEISEIEAHVHPDGNEIDRALGGRAGEEPEQTRERTHDMVETNTVELYSDDAVLLTSDGLIDAQSDYRELYRRYLTSGRDEEVAEEIREAVVTDDLIRDVVIEADSLQAAADEYVRLSNRKGGKDNISVVLFGDDRLPDSPPADRSGLPTRSVDPPENIEQRQTIIRERE